MISMNENYLFYHISFEKEKIDFQARFLEKIEKQNSGSELKERFQQNII